MKNLRPIEYSVKSETFWRIIFWFRGILNHHTCIFVIHRNNSIPITFHISISLHIMPRSSFFRINRPASHNDLYRLGLIRHFFLLYYNYTNKNFLFRLNIDFFQLENKRLNYGLIFFIRFYNCFCALFLGFWLLFLEISRRIRTENCCPILLSTSFHNLLLLGNFTIRRHNFFHSSLAQIGQRPRHSLVCTRDKRCRFPSRSQSSRTAYTMQIPNWTETHIIIYNMFDLEIRSIFLFKYMNQV